MRAIRSMHSASPASGTGHRFAGEVSSSTPEGFLAGSAARIGEQNRLARHDATAATAATRSWFGEDNRHGRTLNPWDPELSQAAGQPPVAICTRALPQPEAKPRCNQCPTLLESVMETVIEWLSAH